MKKYYDLWVNRRNTPNLDLYTCLIRLCYLFAGVNCALGAVFACLLPVDLQETGVGLSIICFIMSCLAPASPKKDDRGLVAVCGAGFIYVLFSIPVILMSGLWMLIICLFELVFLGIVIFRWVTRERRLSKR